MRTISKPLAGASPVASDISTTPVRLRWVIDSLCTADAHRLTLAFTCALARVDQPAERKLFDEVFSPRGAAAGPVSKAVVIDHFMPALRDAASALARNQSAELLLSPGARAQWINALQTAANEVGFMCGLSAAAPLEIELTSPTLQQQRLEQMQRLAAERRSADRVEHFARAAELLKQWESLKTSLPAITPGKLLEQINPADRGAMLDTLLMAGASGQSGAAQPDLWAVSGSTLVRVDGKTGAPESSLIPMPIDAGPLRSVRLQNGSLLIGARSGVLLIDPANPEKIAFYHHPALSSEHGFTSVTVIGNRIWACHREGGLVGWNAGGLNQPIAVLLPAQLGGDPKNLTDNGLFSVKEKLFSLGDSGTPALVYTAAAPIVAVLPLALSQVIVTETGTIVLLDRATLAPSTQIQTTGPLCGAAQLPWLSDHRLLLNRADGPIECIGLEDQLVTQFSAGHTGLRAVTACATRVAAMSNDRQKVVLWNAWDGRKTAGEIHLATTTRHRITDITFG